MKREQRRSLAGVAVFTRDNRILQQRSTHSQRNACMQLHAAHVLLHAAVARAARVLRGEERMHASVGYYDDICVDYVEG